MTRLARTVRFHDDEHVASLLSRLAMMNGVSTTEFCRHLGLNPQALAKGRPDVLNELAHLGGFEPAALKARLPIPEKDVFQIGNERLLFSHVDRIRGGYCPHCVARDRELGVGAMETRAYGRLSWLVRFIATCPIHNALLCAVDPTATDGLRGQFSTTKFSADAFGAIAITCATTDFEGYITARLLGDSKHGGDFLDGLPLHVVGVACELVGVVASRGRVTEPPLYSEIEWVAFRQRGYEILSSAGTPFEDFLRDLAISARNETHHLQARNVYGCIYVRLSALKHPDYSELRDTIRHVSIEELPLGPGDDVFGPLDRRRWHSITTASKEFGIGAPILGKLLKSAGLIPLVDMPLSPNCILFSATEMSAFVRRFRASVDGERARRRLNLSATSFNLLESKGTVRQFVRHRTVGGKTTLYAVDELDDLIHRLAGPAKEADEGPKAMPDVLAVRQLVGCTFMQVVDLLIDGSLRNVALNRAKRGFASILVDPVEVRSAIDRQSPQVVHFEDYVKKTRLRRSEIHKLVERGYLVTSHVYDLETGARRTALAAWSVELFEEDFASLNDLATSLFTDARGLRRELEAAGVVPLLNHSYPQRTLYHLAEIRQLEIGEALR